MADVVPAAPSNQSVAAAQVRDWEFRLRRGAEFVFIPVFALGVSAALFSLFLAALGKSPVEFFSLVWRGGSALCSPGRTHYCAPHL